MPTSQHAVYAHILTCTALCHDTPQVSGAMVQFIRALLRHRPDMRLGGRGGVQEVLEHPGLQQPGGA
mgnify:CR=1 FL=1